MRKIIALSLLLIISCSKEDNSGEIESLENRITSLTSQLSALNAQLSNINSQNSSLNSSLNQLVAEVNILTDQNQLNQNNLAAANNKIDSLTNIVNSFSEKILNHIMAYDIVNGINNLNFGNEIPGTISLNNCDWIPLVTDEDYNVIVALHPFSKTMLISHHSMTWEQNLSQDNLLLFKNFLKLQKSDKYLAYKYQWEHEEKILSFRTWLNNNYQISTFARLPYRRDAWEIGLLSDTMIFDANGIVAQENVIEYQRNYIESPDYMTIIFGIGWKWREVWAISPEEEYSENRLIENLGAKFNVWDSPNKAISSENLLFYPDTYSDNNECY